MSPRASGRRRLFGKARKTVKIEGQKFTAIYTMNKVLVHEPPQPKILPPGSQPKGLHPYVRVHGPYQGEFDYTPFMPHKRNGRWMPGKWLPLVAKQDQKMCYYGYHGCTFDKVKRWSAQYGDNSRERVWLIEGVGPIEKDPKSQEPETTKIIYTMTRPRNGYVWDPKTGVYKWKQTEPKKVRDRKAEKKRNAKIEEARTNGGFSYDLSAEKYNFQSIRILRPLTDTPKRERKPRPKAATTWKMVKGERVQVYTKTGRRVPHGYMWPKAS